MRIAGFILALLFSPAVAWSAERVEVPIRQTVLKDGTPRYSIPMMIGTSQVEGMLDSGSTGIRLLPGAVDVSNLTATKTPSQYSYGSGARFTGVIATASLSIGGLRGPRPIGLQAIQVAGCVEKKPNCPVARIDAKNYRIGGNGAVGQGFMVIVGVNMGSDDAENPFVGMGVNQWIIVLPKMGDRQPGRLILNPSAEDLVGYTLFKIDPQFQRVRGGVHDSIFACLTNTKEKEEFCGPTLLDSGATAVVVTPSRTASSKIWKSRSPATLTFKPVEGAPLSLSFVTDRNKPSTMRFNPSEGYPRNRLVAGSLPYYSFSVLYDASAGVVGLKPR